MRTQMILTVGMTLSAVFLPVHGVDERIPVFVTTAQTAEGFTDPSKDRKDSVKDLLKKLKSSKSVRVVESEQDALAILEVLERDTRREMTPGGKQNKSYLTVRLTAGKYTAEFTGESGSKGLFKGYGAAAGNVVKQLDAWVEANRDHLLALGLKSAPTDPAPAEAPSAVHRP